MRLLSLLIVGVTVGLQCCSPWWGEISFPSPQNKDISVTVQFPKLREGGEFRVLLKHNGMVTKLFSETRDVWFFFCAVSWSHDGRLVGVYARSDPHVRIGYDLMLKKFVPFEDVYDDLAKTIRETYKLETEQLPFPWADSEEGAMAFAQRNPGYKTGRRSGDIGNWN